MFDFGQHDSAEFALQQTNLSAWMFLHLVYFEASSMPMSGALLGKQSTQVCEDNTAERKGCYRSVVSRITPQDTGVGFEPPVL